MGMQYSLKCGELMSLQCRAHRIRGMPAVRPTAGKKCLTSLQAGAWRVAVIQPIIQAKQGHNPHRICATSYYFDSDLTAACHDTSVAARCTQAHGRYAGLGRIADNAASPRFVQSATLACEVRFDEPARGCA